MGVRSVIIPLLIATTSCWGWWIFLLPSCCNKVGRAKEGADSQGSPGRAWRGAQRAQIKPEKRNEDALKPLETPHSKQSSSCSMKSTRTASWAVRQYASGVLSHPVFCTLWRQPLKTSTNAVQIVSLYLRINSEKHHPLRTILPLEYDLVAPQGMPAHGPLLPRPPHLSPSLPLFFRGENTSFFISLSCAEQASSVATGFGPQRQLRGLSKERRLIFKEIHEDSHRWLCI